MIDKLSPEEQKVAALILFVIGIVLTILVLIIFVARIIFWVSVISFLISFFYLIFGSIRDVICYKNDEDFDIYNLPHFLFAMGLILIFWVLVHFAFPIGYSALSYKIINLNEEYNTFMDLPSQITIEALNKTCASIPTYYSCDKIIKSYQFFDTAQDISNTAKLIQKVFYLKV